MADAKGTEAVRRLVAEPPAWLSTLGSDGLGAACGVRLLPTEEWSEPDLDRYPAHTIYNPALVGADRAVRTGKVLVATGPSTPVRDGSYTQDVQWHVDPAAPDRLWCALSSSYPGWLWVPVEPSAEALAEVLRGMFPRPALRRVDFTRHERGHLGLCTAVKLPHVYSGDFVEFGMSGPPGIPGGSCAIPRKVSPIEASP